MVEVEQEGAEEVGQDIPEFPTMSPSFVPGGQADQKTHCSLEKCSLQSVQV